MLNSYEEFHTTLHAWLTEHQVPEHLHRRLYDKIASSLFDSGSRFSLARWPRAEAESESDATDDDGAGGGASGGAAVPTSAACYPGYYLVANHDLRAEEDVWLIDHCCTFQLPVLRDELHRNEALRTRLECIARQEPEAPSGAAVTASESRVDALMDDLWPYLGSYTLLNPRSDDAEARYWFVADEIGSAINVTFDDEEANVRVVTLPFYFASQQCVFSFFWMTAPVEAGTVLTRRPRHRFERYSGELVSRVLYETWSGEPPSDEVVAACREAWQNHYREQAHVSAQRNVQNQLRRAATLALQREHGEHILAEPVYPPLLPALSAEDGAAGEGRLAVHVSHRGVAAALAACAAFRDADGPFRLVSLPSEAAVVWMTHHAFRGSDDFAHARYVVHLPELAQLTNTRNLAALQQHAVGKTPLVVERLDGVSQLALLVGSAVEEGGAECGTAECVWELVGEDGRRVWGPVALRGWPRVRELLRVAEVGPLCLARVLDGEALSLSPGTRMVLHVPVLVRSWQSAATGLEAYAHHFSWASFLPAAGPVTAATEQRCECVPGAVVARQLAALTGRPDIWTSEIYPVLSRTLRDVLAAVVPAEGVAHSRRGGVLDAQFQLLMAADGEASPVMPVLLGFSEHLHYSLVLQQCPTFFADALATLCLGAAANATRL